MDTDTGDVITAPSMPTRGGDVVILHNGEASTDHVLWPVLQNGQQAPSPYASTVVVKTGREAAFALAVRISRIIRSRVFFVDLQSLTWTQLSD